RTGSPGLRVAPARRAARTAYAAVACDGRGSGPRDADALRRPRAILVRARRQGRPSLPGSAEDVRPDDRGAAPKPRACEDRRIGENRCDEAARSIRASRRGEMFAGGRLRRRARTRTPDLEVDWRPYSVGRSQTGEAGRAG